jgi:hypothetical protein
MSILNMRIICEIPLVPHNIIMDMNNVMMHESFASHILKYFDDLRLVVPIVMNGENQPLLTDESVEFKIS